MNQCCLLSVLRTAAAIETDAADVVCALQPHTNSQYFDDGSSNDVVPNISTGGSNERVQYFMVMNMKLFVFCCVRVSINENEIKKKQTNICLSTIVQV